MKLPTYGVPREKPVWLVDDRELERYAGLDHWKVWIWGYGLPLVVSLIGPMLGLWLGIANRAYYDALFVFPAVVSPLIAVIYVRAWRRFFVGVAYCLAIVASEAVAESLYPAASTSWWGEYVDPQSMVWLFLTLFIGETILLCQARLAFLQNRANREPLT